MNMDSEFRQLDGREMGLLQRLCVEEFPGCDELRAQLASVTAKRIIEDGTLELRCDSGPPSPHKGLVVEGWCEDADGMKISVMLHVDRQGFMWMLEILKYDGTQIINQPSSCNLVVGFPGKRFGKSPLGTWQEESST
jgi:hypothetical protein